MKIFSSLSTTNTRHAPPHPPVQAPRFAMAAPLDYTDAQAVAAALTAYDRKMRKAIAGGTFWQEFREYEERIKQLYRAMKNPANDDVKAAFNRSIFLHKIVVWTRKAMQPDLILNGIENELIAFDEKRRKTAEATSRKGKERAARGRCRGSSMATRVAAAGGYFQPRASECVEYAYDPPPELHRLPEPASHIRFPTPAVRYAPSTAPNLNQRNRHPKRSQPGHIPPPLVFDTSDSSDSSDFGSPPDPSNHGSIYPPTPMKQKYHAQHTLSGCVPMSTDLSLPFTMPGKGEAEKYNGRSTKRRSIDELSHSSKRTSSTSRSGKVASAGCTSGFSTLDPGLEGCLGGF
ncbi:hypothetical protein NLJ89_g8302 [Agrocybe chaxingu]|uniref:Uncharacterized protein n=1 Tax=Agrocybe chaxingu TaxID=84603 RepID=A0A9W8MU83_9AGAR|nr:hypothetical protein NLJ89_g8302 [Agrocybe chaxingu]